MKKLVNKIESKWIIPKSCWRYTVISTVILAEISDLKNGIARMPIILLFNSFWSWSIDCKRNNMYDWMLDFQTWWLEARNRPAKVDLGPNLDQMRSFLLALRSSLSVFDFSKAFHSNLENQNLRHIRFKIACFLSKSIVWAASIEWRWGSSDFCDRLFMGIWPPKVLYHFEPMSVRQSTCFWRSDLCIPSVSELTSQPERLRLLKTSLSKNFRSKCSSTRLSLNSSYILQTQSLHNAIWKISIFSFVIYL